MKRLKNIGIVLLILMIPLIIISNFKIVDADSGWDSSYDFGGSSSSWSSGSSSWGSGSSYYSGSGDSTYSIVYIVVFIIVVIIVLASKGSNTKTNTNRMNFNDVPEAALKNILPNLTIGYLKQSTYNKFIEIQKAWMDFDYDKLRELCTDELYNSYISQLDTLKLKNGKNIMSDFMLNDIKIVDIKEEDKDVAIQVYMNVTFYDYVINEKTQQVIRGTKSMKITNNYLMTFVRSKEDIIKDISCPNCGAPINNNASNKCDYCDSTIVKSSSDFVLSKKTNINR